MLFKNEEPYKLFDNDIKEVERYFHNKFPVKVIYPPERIVPSKLKHNRLPDKPASISFDLRATVKTPKGIEIWRYAESVVTDDVGKEVYRPPKFIFQGTRFLERSDIELIFFLLRKSEFRLLSEEELKENKTLKQANRPKFAFEDLVTEAERRVAKKELQQKIDALLYGEMALPEEKLRAVAKAFFITNVDNLTLPQVKISLDSEVRRTKENPDRFFDMVNAEEELNTRASIQKVIDLKILQYDVQKKTWYWKVVGDKDVMVCKIPPNVSNATEALYEHYKGSQDFREDVKTVLISKRPSTSKLKGKETDEEKEE
jgi:hypothetical protein